MIRKQSAWLFIVIVLTVPIIAYAIVTWYEKSYASLPVYGRAGHRIEHFDLTNHNGEKISLTDWQNKIVVADFFFTSCPSICPKMTSALKKVLDQFPQENDLQINSFTVDPENDNVSKLSAYATRFGITNRWNLLTGDKREIYKLARNSFLVVATDGDGGKNDFIHSEKLVLVDKNQRIRGFYDGTSDNDVSLLLNDIKKLWQEKN